MNQGMNQGVNQGMNQGMNQTGCPIGNNSEGLKSRFFNKRNLLLLLGLFFVGLLIYFFMNSKTQSNKELLSPKLSAESLQKQTPLLYQPHLPKLDLPSHISSSLSSKSIGSSRASISSRSSLSSRASGSSKASSSSSSSVSSKLSARSGVNPNLIEKLKSISLG